VSRTFFILLSAASLFAGCAAPPGDNIAPRRIAYQRLLRYIEPGMTRRQLYALLPPARTPLAVPPQFAAVIGTVCYTPQTEQHPLDDKFSLSVEYRPADVRAFPKFRLTPKWIDEFLFPKSPPPKPRPSRQNLDDELAARPVLRGPGVPAPRTVFMNFIEPKRQ
jgi:hypothetical protein